MEQVLVEFPFPFTEPYSTTSQTNVNVYDADPLGTQGDEATLCETFLSTTRSGASYYGKDLVKTHHYHYEPKTESKRKLTKSEIEASKHKVRDVRKRNRINAERYRKRKRQLLDKLEVENASLKDKVRANEITIERLQTENSIFKDTLNFLKGLGVAGFSSLTLPPFPSVV